MAGVKLAQSEYEAVYSAIADVVDLPIIIDDTPASELTIHYMRSVLRRVEKKYGSVGLVVLDYLQKLGDRAAANRAQTVGKYSGACKDLAKTFDVPFIALAQINRGVEGQNNKRPSMAQIKDSGDVEQDCDQVWLLYRDSYYNEQASKSDRCPLEIIVAKNRNGATGSCKVWFDPAIGQFSNLQENYFAN